MEDFLSEGLDPRQRARVLRTLEAIRLRGLYDPRACKKLPGSGALWEIRARHKNARIRILAGIDGGRLVLLHGLIKKTGKLDRSEIDLASRRFLEYRSARP